MCKNVVVPFLCLLTLIGCSSKEHEEIENLQSKVMAVHDDLMLEMGKLSELKTSLSARNEALKSGGDSLAAEQVILNDMIITNLDVAHENMMAWMRQFQKVDLEDDAEANKDYLQAQLAEIQAVKQEMGKAIQSAQQALDK